MCWSSTFLLLLSSGLFAAPSFSIKLNAALLGVSFRSVSLLYLIGDDLKEKGLAPACCSMIVVLFSLKLAVRPSWSRIWLIVTRSPDSYT